LNSAWTEKRVLLRVLNFFRPCMITFLWNHTGANSFGEKMKLGIIGLQGAGKSTIFEALTRQDTSSGHRGENLVGTVTVPDYRVDLLKKMYNPKKTVYAQVAYLLPGVSNKNDGNSDQKTIIGIRDSDAFIHVIRNFSRFGAKEPEPYNDFKKTDQEFILSDLIVIEKRLERLGLDKKRGKKVDPKEIDLLNQCKENLEAEIPLRKVPELAQAHLLRGYAFLSAKPVLVLFNNEDENDNIPHIDKLTDIEKCMVIKGKLEQELAYMSEEEAKEFLLEFNITSSAMDRVIKMSYQLLGLISFFTVGEDEVKAWTIKKDIPAMDAAGEIHSDIKKGFIRAEVLAYDDLIDAGTYNEARKKGTVRLEGKTYIVADGDIINFRFNV